MSSLFLTFYLGLVMALFHSFFLREGGFAHMRALSAQEALLADNVADLREVNKALADEMRMLTSDAEAIRLLARELGYYQPKEQVMKVVGLPTPAQARTVGRLVRSRPAGPPAGASRAVPAALFLAPSVCLLLVRLFTRGDDRRRRDRSARRD
jgi:cell division protein FtsB